MFQTLTDSLLKTNRVAAVHVLNEDPQLQPGWDGNAASYSPPYLMEVACSLARRGYTPVRAMDYDLMDPGVASRLRAAVIIGHPLAGDDKRAVDRRARKLAAMLVHKKCPLFALDLGWGFVRGTYNWSPADAEMVRTDGKYASYHREGANLWYLAGGWEAMSYPQSGKPVVTAGGRLLRYKERAWSREELGETPLPFGTLKVWDLDEVQEVLDMETLAPEDAAKLEAWAYKAADKKGQLPRPAEIELAGVPMKHVPWKYLWYLRWAEFTGGQLLQKVRQWLDLHDAYETHPELRREWTASYWERLYREKYAGGVPTAGLPEVGRDVDKTPTGHWVANNPYHGGDSFLGHGALEYAPRHWVDLSAYLEVENPWGTPIRSDAELEAIKSSLRLPYEDTAVDGQPRQMLPWAEGNASEDDVLSDDDLEDEGWVPSLLAWQDEVTRNGWTFGDEQPPAKARQTAEERVRRRVAQLRAARRVPAGQETPADVLRQATEDAATGAWYESLRGYDRLLLVKEKAEAWMPGDPETGEEDDANGHRPGVMDGWERETQEVADALSQEDRRVIAATRPAWMEQLRAAKAAALQAVADARERAAMTEEDVALVHLVQALVVRPDLLHLACLAGPKLVRKLCKLGLGMVARTESLCRKAKKQGTRAARHLRTLVRLARKQRARLRRLGEKAPAEGVRFASLKDRVKQSRAWQDNARLEALAREQARRLARRRRPLEGRLADVLRWFVTA